MAAKLAKRNIALVLGFQGTRFQGLQMAQAGTRTIEGEVHKALVAAGAISDSNAGDRKKVKWSSASRTDKGVHSASCVCSVKLLVDETTGENVSEKTLSSWNSLLPPDIRILAGLRCGKNSRAHSMCSIREYEYIMPVSALCGHPLSELRRLLSKYQGTHRFHNFC
eukprot:CAMPEP_0180199838 /NCGR_PEP_ID=MMETSP0987-20121128/5923_1 /TAXON_ID=697907 /ORGANISM="non described non described, Strain CCMP2293" /LENGTH=165 /DNA_ID=CAMNT_0022154951 /DNA_START=93 /DNA_END=587 /DNA_ORIENTATION=+